MTTPITINTDGACSGNPGPGGFAAIIDDPHYGHLTITGGDPQTTNNRMELAAVIEAFKAINSAPKKHDAITVRSDSQYVIKAFNDRWLDNWQRNNWRKSDKKPVENKELWQTLLQETQGHNIKWEWIKGHSGDPGNEECDRLATAQIPVARNQTQYWCITGNAPLSETPARKPHPSDPAEANQQNANKLLLRGMTAVENNDPRELLLCAIEALDAGQPDAFAYARKAALLMEQ